MSNKKVLLRERKRHTNRGVSSTPAVIRGEDPPPPRPGLMGGGGVLPKVGYPPARSDGAVPKVGSPREGLTGGGYPRWGTPIGVPLARSDGDGT